MIIIKLVGGLGNQLFQYALGRHLAVKNNTELKFDKTYLLNNSQRKFRLDEFLIEATEASAGEILNAKVIKEKTGKFDPEVLALKEDIYLDGYWQSEQYFSDIREILLKDIKLKRSLSEKNMTWLKFINSANSLAIHIRRGDYVTNLVSNEYHGVLREDYYLKAIEYFLRSVGTNLSLCFFSDDPEWVKHSNLFQKVGGTIIESNSSNECEDLMLISACKYFIIANSSFSWWGAWLNSHVDKQVCAPRQWFRDPAARVNHDVVPVTWQLF